MNRPGQPRVANRPRREHQQCRGGKHGQLSDRGRGRVSAQAMTASQTGSNSRFGRICIAAPASPPASTNVGRCRDACARMKSTTAAHEQHRAEGVGCLRRCVDRVERETRNQHRGHQRLSFAGPRANRRVDQQRHEPVEERLHHERYPLAVAEEAVENGKKRRIPPRHLERRIHLAARERQRVLTVVVEAFPTPRMRSFDEDERQTETDGRSPTRRRERLV
jgi:hypothetical protein